MRHALITLATVGLWACAGNPFEGTYEIVQQTRNDASCDVEGAAVTPWDPYFKLEEKDFFGTTILGYHSCVGVDACDDSISLDRSLLKDGGTWKSESIFASGSGGTCSVSLTEGVLSETEDGIRFDVRESSGTVTVAGDADCDTDLVDSHRNELVCNALEVVRARSI